MSNDTIAKKRQPIRLTNRKIIDWANAHFVRRGKWPTYRSGRVVEFPDLDWSSIDGCLEFGGFGVPGGSSLAYLLARHRGLESGRRAPMLSIQLILVWADRHHIRTGTWPMQQTGPVIGVPGETWVKIDRALRKGSRGFAGQSSLSRLLAEHRGKRHNARAPDLSIKDILAWADDHHERTGLWPKKKSGRIHANPVETWGAIAKAMYNRRRGLSDGKSLPRLLMEQRGVVTPQIKGPLAITDILAWADEHHRRTGRWPRQTSGVVHESLNDTWSGIDLALGKGCRGLPGHSSLAKLLTKQRGAIFIRNKKPLTVQRILAWSDEHHERTGSWPTVKIGAVAGVAGENWKAISTSLRYGRRGLRPAHSLSSLLVKHRKDPYRVPLPRFTVAQILAWADRHKRRTGDWPRVNSGPIVGAKHETWCRVDTSLHFGYIRTGGPNSLLTLLAKHRDKPVPQTTTLTKRQILKWADEEFKRTGRWPTRNTGPLKSNPNDSWRNIDNAMRGGSRGFSGGSSLSRLLAEKRGVPLQCVGPTLTVDAILKWADHHYAETGRWPSAGSGFVLSSPPQRWGTIDVALCNGRRGLPGGSSLAKLLEAHGRKRSQRTMSRLTRAKILQWADRHKKRTGKFPNQLSGSVVDAPEESWNSVSCALKRGHRGLPGGESLYRLIRRRRRV